MCSLLFRLFYLQPLPDKVRLEMRNYLKDVRLAFQIPIILVTHDVAEAYTLADNIVVYARGRIARTGSPSDIFCQPFNKEIESLFIHKELYTAGVL